MKLWLPALPLLALLAAAPLSPCAAQAPPAAGSLVKASADPLTIAAGTNGVVKVHLAILPGWHINANPPALEYNIATQVSLAGAFGITAAKPFYPAPVKKKFAFEEQELWVWDGATEVTVPIVAAAQAVNGRHELRGRVEYQGCNDQVCLAPTSVPFTFAVTVTGGAPAGSGGGANPADSTASGTGGGARDSVPASMPGGGGFQTAPPPAGSLGAPGAPAAGTARNRLADALASGGLGWWLALFLGGLLLNLTPCVFPMLGITVSIFGARRKEPLPKVIGHAIAYVLGLCAMYSALGLVAALTGGLFGSALQNPLVNVVLGLLLVALSLSMFGFYEMQPPNWMLDRLGGADTGSIVGIFLSGLAVGIIAAPCVGPFVIAVLAIIAQRGNALFGLQTMFVLSLGLGFPYLFLAAFSNLLQTLPRSGEWMDWVKKFFGVVLASLGLFYALLGVAPRLAPWILPAGLVLGGLYLGFMEKSANANRAFRLAKRAGGVMAVMAGVLLVLQMTSAASRAMVFKPYDEAAVKASLAAGRGVMLDFSADWCVPCHELELQTFPDARVIAASRRFDGYHVDLTHYDSPQVESWRKRYGIAGVPTIVFLGAGGVEVRAARVEGFVGPEVFVQRLETAATDLR